MASSSRYTNPTVCWNLLAEVLSYGYTIPFLRDNQTPCTEYVLSDQKWFGYQDVSSPQYLMEDIHHALFVEGCEKIILYLDGKEHGPIIDHWSFTFTKDGLVEAYNIWDAD